MRNVNLEELKKTSFLKIKAFDDRSIPLLTCLAGHNEWELWFPASGKLIQISGGAPVEALYFAKEAQLDSDIYSEFVNLVIKQAYFKDLVHFERAIVEDINNLAVSIGKLELFHQVWLDDNSKINTRFATTEIEYVLKVCRSLFDLLQEVISKIWKRFRYLDTNLKTKPLNSSFSKMVLKSNQQSTSQEIAERYLIPSQLAEFYFRHGTFFVWLRSFRDKIIHSGHGIDFLYITTEGFAIATNQEPFEGLSCWKETVLKKNDLGSVRSLLAYIIKNTLLALEDFSVTIKGVMKLPDDIAPDHNVYIRGKNLSVLGKLDSYMKADAWG